MTKKTVFFPKMKLGAILLDCVLEETHAYESEITDYPIENGSYVQDTVWLKPFKLTIDGTITDTQLLDNKPTTTVQSRIGGVYDSLIALKNTKDVFQVMTGLKLYKNMIFETWSVQRDTETGYSIHLTATLKQITKVSALNQTSADTTKTKSFNKTVNQGTQQMKKTAPKTLPKKNVDDICANYGICYG
jgi:hypothetical protein